jgi:hypothetical protein
MAVHKDAAQLLIETINATGGLLEFSDGTYAPRGDPEWIDLGEAYLAACAEKASTPVVAPTADTEFPAEVDDHFRGTGTGSDYHESDLSPVAAEPASMIDIHSVLVTSTAHLTFRDTKMLTRIGYRRGEYGWLMYVGRADGPMPEVDLPSAGLVGAILCAREKRCAYLLFDDGRELPGVPAI